MKYVLLLFAFFALLPFSNLAAQCDETLSITAPDFLCTGETTNIEATEIAGATYLWSNGTSTRITDATAGTYSVTVSYGTGCTLEASTTIEESEITISDIITRPASANCLGSFDVTVEGAQPFRFTTSLPDGTVISVTRSPFDLSPGEYIYTITDSLNCTLEIPFLIDEIEPLIISIDEIDVSTCGQQDAAINVSVIGGTPPYFYDWSNGESTQSLQNLAPGTYSLTVTDAVGCNSITFVTIQDALVVDFDRTNVSTCGQQDGSVIVSVTGGTPPYIYTWSNGAEGQALQGLVPGAYFVTITDATGCLVNESFIISQDEECINGLIIARGLFDENQNCQADNMEWNIPNLPFKIQFVQDTLLDQGLLDLIPNSNTFLEGFQYFTDNSNFDNYPFYFYIQEDYNTNYTHVKVTLQQANSCISHQYISIEELIDLDDFFIHFPLQAEDNCPVLTVDIGAPLLRRCFESTYNVHYGNYGLVDAEAAYIDVQLDAFLSFVASPLEAEFLGENTYRFQVGEVASGEFGDFNIQVEVSCESELGQTHCTEAHIYPDAPCEDWTGAELQATARCEGDEVLLSIENVGESDMQDMLYSIVTEDIIILRTDSVRLAAGETLDIRVPASGSTYRIEVPQVNDFPFTSRPSASVEGCGTNANGSSSTGITNLFSQGDYEPYLSIDCQQNIGAYDPNDKRGLPLGFYDEHFIEPNTDLEYQIRFQNTGTDTAFNVVVLDTLSEHMNWNSIQAGSSSHLYTFDRLSENVIRFQFQDILLPDSTTNEVASHGFINFRIAQNSDVALGSRIENRAAIYFDFNEAVLTNTTLHTVGMDFLEILSPVEGITLPDLDVMVQPNPFTTSVEIDVKGTASYLPLQFELFDIFGRKVRKEQVLQNPFMVHRNQLQAGIYFFRLSHEGEVVSVGKMELID